MEGSEVCTRAPNAASPRLSSSFVHLEASRLTLPRLAGSAALVRRTLCAAHSMPHLRPRARELCALRGKYTQPNPPYRFRAKSGRPEMFYRLLPEIQGQDLDLTVLYVPPSLDSGSPKALTPGACP